MSRRDGSRLELLFLKACEGGELQTIRELVKSKAVDPNRIIDERMYTYGWTPLHHASKWVTTLYILL